MPIHFLIRLLLALIPMLTSPSRSDSAAVYSSRLIHRFSDEARAFIAARRKVDSDSFNLGPRKKSLDYYQTLLASDFRRQQMKLGHRFQLLFPSEGSAAVSSGNELGWLHYTWIDIGTPNVSFLVALDTGSDLLWVPCDCIQCAPLSANYYSSLDRDLNEYSPGSSNTSRHLSCSHRLCQLGSNCKSSAQPCPYTVRYFSEDTSSSGLLVQDVFHVSSSSSHSSTTSIVVGCGRKQSGDYLGGVAPDGVMGLGFGEISVPSFLAKAGLVRNSFSLCFSEDGSGSILFGDQGLSTQHAAPFRLYNGKYETYFVEAEASCVGKNSCLRQTGFQALVDSGTSFTFLPHAVYEKVVEEFDRQVNATRETYDGYPWNYCYKTSVKDRLQFPPVRFMLASNSSFTVLNPMFPVDGDQGIVVGYCLAIQPMDGDIGLIGQNFMTGYRMVFDRENMKLGWSLSDCKGLSSEERVPAAPSPDGNPPNPLPTSEQQSSNRGHAISPAVAGRAPTASASSGLHPQLSTLLFELLLLLLLSLQLLRTQHEIQ